MSTEAIQAANEPTLTMVRRADELRQGYSATEPTLTMIVTPPVPVAAATTSDVDTRETTTVPAVHRAPVAESLLPEPTRETKVVAPTALAPDEQIAETARLLGIDPAEVPRLTETIRAALNARGASLDVLLAEADALGLSQPQALATLIALNLPERFASVADFALAAPSGQAQATLSMYVTAVLTDELAANIPRPEALRFAAIASSRATRLAPDDMFLVAVGIPRLVDAMGNAGRIETTTAVAALVYAAPDTLARAVHEGREVSLLHEARVMAERFQNDSDADTRGLAVAACFVLLASSASPHEARAVYERAHNAVAHAAPRIILSSIGARRQGDNDDDDANDDAVSRVAETLDRLEPFLENYDRLRAQMVNVHAVPRAELCNTLHLQLTRGSEQFYMALLSLLRRHSALCTRPGSRALRTALKERDMWDALAVA